MTEIPELWWSPMEGLIHRDGSSFYRLLSDEYIGTDLPADAVQLAPVGPTPCCTNGQKDIDRLADERDAANRRAERFKRRAQRTEESIVNARAVIDGYDTGAILDKLDAFDQIRAILDRKDASDD